MKLSLKAPVSGGSPMHTVAGTAAGEKQSAVSNLHEICDHVGTVRDPDVDLRKSGVFSKTSC